MDSLPHGCSKSFHGFERRVRIPVFDFAYVGSVDSCAGCQFLLSELLFTSEFKHCKYQLIPNRTSTRKTQNSARVIYCFSHQSSDSPDSLSEAIAPSPDALAWEKATQDSGKSERLKVQLLLPQKTNWLE
jgi:hypothetical protein